MEPSKQLIMSLCLSGLLDKTFILERIKSKCIMEKEVADLFEDWDGSDLKVCDEEMVYWEDSVASIVAERKGDLIHATDKLTEDASPSGVKSKDITLCR